MGRIDRFLLWMAELAGRCPRWVRTWAPLLGAFSFPLTLCLVFVVLPVFFQREGIDTESPIFSTVWLIVAILAILASLFGALFSIVLALYDPPADLRR